LRENGSNDFAHFAYLDRSHQYLQLFYWHQVLENSSRAFRGHFRSKISVFWTFLKKYCFDRSDIPYLDRSYQYLQLFYWHHARENTSRAFIGHFVDLYFHLAKVISISTIWKRPGHPILLILHI
jgi:hypothetical protein